MPIKTEKRGELARVAGAEYDTSGELRGVDPMSIEGRDLSGGEDKDDAEERLQMLVTRAAEEAILWREEDLDFEQAKATDYYMGRPFGNEAPGRSRVVSTDVRDTIQAILPSLMRIFFGPENTVEYEPTGPEDVAAAEQLTDMANYVIRNDNEGFLQIHGAMKDAMVRKLGVLKVWWDDSEREEGQELTGLTDMGLQVLEQEEGVEVNVRESYSEAMEGSPTGFVTLHDAYVSRTHDDGRVRFACIPSEEFFFSPEARSRDDCEMMAHIRAVPASEIVAMGVDKDLVDEHKGRIRYTATGDDLAAERRFDQDQREQLDDERDVSREECWFGEVYVYADMSEDEDGTAELIKCRVIGDNHELVDWYVCDERPFALFTCDPEPHTLVGPSIADRVMDIQLIKSSIIRGQLDSLTLSLNPRTGVVEGKANMADVMNHEVGAVVRMEAPGMVQELVHDFSKSGGAAFPMLQYQDEQKENRTGQSKAAMGLDADALQSSTKAAVAATLSGAQQHIEMLARVFAETGMRQLYSLIHKTLVENQDQGRMIRLRGEWIEMDPRSWNADMDVRINLALGSGGTEERLKLLDLITTHQKQLMDEGSPLVDRTQYRAGLARMVELAGFPNPDEFYKKWGEQEEQQFQQQQAQQQQQQDPAMVLAQSQIENDKLRLQMDMQEMVMKDARERSKIELDFAIKQATAEAQYSAKIDDQELMADAATAKAVIDAASKEAVGRQGGGNVPTTQQAPQGGPQGVGGGA